MTPTLTSSRLVLTPLRDALRINVEWINNKDNVKYSERRHKSHTFNDCRAYVRGFNHETDHIWAIQVLAEHEYVGNITVTGDAANNTAEIAILVDRNYWRKGYGKEAWQTVLDWLLEKKNVRKVEAGAMKANLPMIKIFEKTGMIFDGERKNQFLLDGNPVSVVHYCKFGMK